MKPTKRNVQLPKSRETDPVEVFCRIRPMENQDDDFCAKAIDDCTVELIPPPDHPKFQLGPNGSIKGTQSRFTHVFDDAASQKDVFDRIAFPLIEDLFRGKNSLLFAYGVTGSGKTFTMMGKPENEGVLMRSLDTIFNSMLQLQAGPCVVYPDKTYSNGFALRPLAEAYIEHHKRKLNPINGTKTPFTPRHKKKIDAIEWETVPRVPETARVASDMIEEDNAYAVFISYIEIYNNYVYDLLDINNIDERGQPISKDLKTDSNKMQYVKDVVEVEVQDTKEAFDWVIKGQQMRRTAMTALNADSSRSHSVFNIRLVQVPLASNGREVIQDKEKIHVSQLSIVDLAGSERTSRTGHVGERLKEAGKINNSLLQLRQCIQALRENQQGGYEIVQFRGQKLTELFQYYFCGGAFGSKVRMIVCINPRSGDYDENRHVMEFAEVTQEVEIQRAVGIEDLDVGNELTPGRRRAAKLFDQDAAFDEMFGGRGASDSPLPIAPRNSIFFIKMPMLQINRPDDDVTINSLIEHFERQRSRRAQYQADLARFTTAYEDNIKRMFYENKGMRQRYDEVKKNSDRLHGEVTNLKSENRQLQHEVTGLATRLSRYESVDRVQRHQIGELGADNQAKAMQLRGVRNKLAQIKTVIDSAQAPSVVVGKRSNADSKVQFGAVSGGLYPRLPTGSCENLAAGSLPGARRRGPSPPPKPKMGIVRQAHRRSRSVGGVVFADDPHGERGKKRTSDETSSSSESKRVRV